jgi:hypothetical protein
MTSNDNPLCTDDDDDDDPFTFKRRSFTRKPLSSTVDTPVKSKGRKRKKGLGFSGKNWEAINRKSRETLEKLTKKAEESDTDSGVDSDGEVTRSVKQPSAPPPAPAINLLMDSSDEDESLVLPPSQTPVHSFERSGVSKATCDVLLKARTAKLELQKAQVYRAEDIYVPLDVPLQNGSLYSSHYHQAEASRWSSGSFPSHLQQHGALGGNVQMPMLPSRPPAGSASANLGPSLKITLRSVTVSEGNTSSPSCDKQTITIRRNEQFEALLSRFLAAKKIDPSSTQVVMKFDGQTIAMSKTPASYDMDDEDMVDCEIRIKASTTAAAAAVANPTPAKIGGRSCRLKLVTSSGQKGQSTIEMFSIKHLHTVQVLVDQYRAAHNLTASTNVALKFDGELMKTNRTLQSYDVDDDDQIDVVLK